VTLIKGAMAHQDQDGAAAVEFALVLPLLALLVMGIADYGYFFFSQQIVTNAAREGARTGTLVDPGGSTPTSAAQTTATTAATTAAQTLMNDNGIRCPSGGYTCITSSYTTTGGLPAIDVQVQYAARSLTGFTAVILPAHVSARATMRWQ
jgi:Flp pilus assembly protein TadG